MKEKRIVCLGIALILLVMLFCGILLQSLHSGPAGSFEATVVFEAGLCPGGGLPISFLFPAMI